jgi:hypothetical protein
MTVLSETVYKYALRILPTLSGNYLEIGVFNGSGFSEVARESHEKQCYAVDPFIEDGHTTAHSGMAIGKHMPKQKENFLGNTRDLSNITLFEMTSNQFAQELNDQLIDKMNISLITIDGDHHYPNVVIDFDIAVRLLSTRGGYIIVDDTDVKDVHQAYEEFLIKFKDRIIKEETVSGSTKVIILDSINE